MNLQRPALDPADAPQRNGSTYPEPFASRVLPREKRLLASTVGLTKLGVNLTTLPPGKQSSMRHFHTLEDEMVFVIEGEVTLVTDAGEQLLRAGQCAGFPCGTTDGHHLINKSAQPVRYLEISSKDPADTAGYSDVDLVYLGQVDGKSRYSHKDGTPY